MAAETEKILIEVEIDNKQAQANEIALIKAIERSKQELALRRKELKSSNGTNKEAAKRIGELTRQISSNNTQLRNNQKELKANDNSINGLRASVSRLTAERNNLDTSTAEGNAKFKQLTKSIKDQNDQLKELEGSTGDFRRNVGDYTNSMKEALAQTDLFGGGLGDLFGDFKSMGGAIKSVLPVMKGLRGAMLALPIFVIITALTSLIAFLKSTKKGTEFLEKSMAALSAVSNTIIQSFAKVGEVIFEAFSNPKQTLIDLGNAIVTNVINRFKSMSVFIEAISLAFEGEFKKAALKATDAMIQLNTGVTDGTQKIKDGIDATVKYTKTLGEAAVEGFNLAAANIALKNSIREANLAAATQQQIAEKNRKLRDDERLSLGDRLKANNAILEAERKRTDAQKRAVNARIQTLKNEQTISKKITNEQLDTLNELNIELLGIQEDFLSRTTEQLTEEVSITREAEQQKAQARLDGLNAQLLALDEGSKLYLAKQIEIINEEAKLQQLQATQEVTNTENLNQKLLLIEAERIAAIKALKQEDLNAINETIAAKKALTDATEKEAAKQIEAEKALQLANSESAAQSAISSGQRAESFKDATSQVLGAIRAQIKALLAQAVAEQIASALSKVPYPFNIVVATAAGATAGILFETLIPAFATGGIVSGGVPINRSNGDNVLITAKKGEAILNSSQQSKIGGHNLAAAGVPGFASGGLVGSTLQSNAINNSVTSGNDSNTAIVEALKNMPNPILEYKEFTRFQDRVIFKESRANS